MIVKFKKQLAQLLQMGEGIRGPNGFTTTVSYQHLVRDLPSTQLEKAYTVISSQFRKFTYKELEKATKNFKEELGRGGSGVVYKGILDDERAAAVKKLEDVSQGEEEFQAELSLIGRIYHMNLVRMWGVLFTRFA
ncbi:receptor protein kinase ZmPK1 [Canna indica]|uniref:non-specific serine/threonine protein kinase n=1 Tax=Canna indica TaxID=4628 RepID=A0AAQ3KET3_9LILI|nr:receptor protein kinase ZmPK1 [Canna indica]